MYNGLARCFLRRFFLNAAYNPSRRSLCAASAPLKKEQSADDLLINRGDFRGVAKTRDSQSVSQNPEVLLSNVQQNIQKNFRVSGETILFGFIQQLEQNNNAWIETLNTSSNRWVSLLISACGSAMSNIHKDARNAILDRLVSQLNNKGIKLTIAASNARLKAMLENEADWDPQLELANLEKSDCPPNEQTFAYFIERFALKGNVEGCRSMIYEMGRRGFVINDAINASLIFCFAVRGHNAKANSLLEQSHAKYGAKGAELANGALVRAAAHRGNTDLLRQILRKAINMKTKKLNVRTDDIMDAIWHLAEISRDGTGAEKTQLVEQMLNCTVRDAGFFHKLYREIERHIIHRHYYTSVALLEDTKRIELCLKNQQKNLFLHQLLGQLSTQLIRNKEPLQLIRDVVNRVHCAFNDSRRTVRMYDDLLYAALLMKRLTVEERFQYLSAFIDHIDPRREREHIVLPILTAVDDVDDRLAILYRFTNLGYHDLSKLDIGIFSKLVLQPVYDAHRSRKDMSRLDKVGRVLKSYGVKDKPLWGIMHTFYKKRLHDENRQHEDQWVRPFASELRGWCRAYYTETFDDVKNLMNTPVKVSYEQFKSYVEQGDILKVTTILSKKDGWPSDTNFEEIVHLVLYLYLKHEGWNCVQQMLSSLSSCAYQWSADPSKTPLKNYHIIAILRRFIQEEKEFSIRKLTEYAYELRNLFPNATASYETFFETQTEYNKLFSQCFERLESGKMSVWVIDELIDLLRSLVKLDIIQLHQSETVTTSFVNLILRKVGWDEALNTWQKFLSGLHCSNGMVALLRFCIGQNSDSSKRDIQYVLHRASTFMPKSRVNCLYAGMLVLMRRMDEAEQFCTQIEKNVDPFDCVVVMRLFNALRARSLDEQFILDFTSMCLEHFKLAESQEAAQMMQADLLRICDIRHMGPAALHVYELFADHGIELRPDERIRLATAVDKHAKLADRWIFEPEGFLNLSPQDPIVVDGKEAQIEKRLRQELQQSA